MMPSHQAEGYLVVEVKQANTSRVIQRRKMDRAQNDTTEASREEHDVAGANAEVVARVEAYLRTARTPSQQWPGGQ